MRIMALDIGDVRIGVAVSDPLGITAQGLTVIERIGIKKDCDRIIELIKEYQCETVVIGLNKRLDGKDTIQTEKVYEFKSKLENKLTASGFSNVKLAFQDERLSTTEAEKILIDANLSRKKRKHVIDKQAAVIILQRYLSTL